MKAEWVPHDIRDRVVDFVRHWSERSGYSISRFSKLLKISRSKFYEWLNRYGKENNHNGKIHRDNWLEDKEREAIVDYYKRHPLDGYRRLTFMMLDEDIVAVSPTTTWRVLSEEGLLNKWNKKLSKKGTGFEQPQCSNEHWHTDISHVNICGTIYFLCSVLDGYSRLILHWELKSQMKEKDVELVIQKAKELYPAATPRIISDNGPQFIAKDFKEFIRICGMSHVRTSPYYPQSNGKIERWHKSLKKECIRVHNIDSHEDASAYIKEYLDYYNHKRLHSAIGYVAPIDKFLGREQEIFASRDKKLEAAREARKAKRKLQNNLNDFVASSASMVNYSMLH